eukprot:gene20660-biopygen10127
MSLGTAPFLAPDGLAAPPDETVSGRACRKHASLPQPGCVTAAPGETENPFSVGNPGCHPPHPFRAAGCLCVCRMSARAVGVPVDGQVIQKLVSGGMSLGTAPFLAPDGLAAPPDETVSG